MVGYSLTFAIFFIEHMKMTRASSLGRLDHPVLIYVPRPAAPAPADRPAPGARAARRARRCWAC